MKKYLLFLLFSVNSYAAEGRLDSYKKSAFRTWFNKKFGKRRPLSSEKLEARYPIMADDSGVSELSSPALQGVQMSYSDKVSFAWTNMLPEELKNIPTYDLMSEVMDKYTSLESSIYSMWIERDDKRIDFHKSMFHRNYHTIARMMNYILKINDINQDSSLRERAELDRSRVLEGYEAIKSLDYETYRIIPAESFTRKFILSDTLSKEAAINSERSFSLPAYEIAINVKHIKGFGVAYTTYLKTIIEKYDAASKSFSRSDTTMGILKFTEITKFSFNSKSPSQERDEFDLYGLAAY